ncbi:relaxase domain-containing protein [bacterium]|nr:relaxase domain-containing protein [bacterium]
MLIATQSKNIAATRQYFETVLTQGDYYLGQEVAGNWHGRGAESLGLGAGSRVTREQFAALLSGKHPLTGAALTQRQRQDRRPGVDLTFSVPKSVSLAWAINHDERVVDALRLAVQETMQKDVEPLMMRRVRDKGRSATKERTKTGKLIYAEFLHKTSRPVEGRPDPHLHIHAFVINWTEQNGKHYAGELEEIIRQRPALQAKFEARLANRLKEVVGYGVERVQYRQGGRFKTGSAITGIERATIEKFSRRTEQVEAVAEQNKITDASKKGRLGKLTREKKSTDASIDELRKEWKSRLTGQEREAFQRLTTPSSSRADPNRDADIERALKFALDHHLFRQSTVERHQIVGTALEHAVSVLPERMEEALSQMKLIRRSHTVEGANREFITTREVLAAERDVIAFARDGRGTRRPLGKADHELKRDWLNDQQKTAVRHVLTSRDVVMAITGGAGTGKSSLMQEAAEAVRGYGKEVRAFAPSTGACEVLQEKGFKNAQTVEYLLRSEKLQSEIKGQVLWIDEAGLLDVRSVRALFQIAKKQEARVVLSGDTRQHASPRRGEALRLLEREAGLNIARVEKIQRQKGDYQRAVELISKGHEIIDSRTGTTGLLAGFDLLDRLGKIKELPTDDRHALLAQSYVKSEQAGKSTLIVAPTHKEAAAVTQEIRKELRQKSLLTEMEHAVTQLRSLNLTDAQKSEPTTYADSRDWVIQFHQNVKGGFKKGDRYRVTGVQGNQVALISLDGQQEKSLPSSTPERFEVYRDSTLQLSVGDKVRFSLGGKTRNGKQRISNGRLDEVRSINTDGDLILKSGLLVDRNYGHLDLGYVVTSHASQGKDRHVAIAAMGSESLPAINAKQFYVTASRGSEDVQIYVDDKAKVRRAIARSGEQMSATEMLAVAKSNGDQGREYAPTRREQRSWGRRAMASFQDRIVSWWRDRANNSAARHGAGRQRPVATRHVPHFGPELSRSY